MIEAAADFDEALRLNPKHEDCLYYLGQCQRILKQPAEARRAYLEKRDPDFTGIPGA